MRIETHSLESFIANIEDAPGVYRARVYCDRIKNPIDGTKRDAIKWHVLFQASAVLLLSDEGQALLQLGVDCGTDVRDAQPDESGSDWQAELFHELKEYCKKSGLTILPGTIDMG